MAALLAMLVHAVQTIQASQNEVLEERIAEGTKELEDALAEARGLLKHNRVLLREVHHRTKNNLQVVASLLSLRQHADDDTDSGSRKVIDIARNHVYSMAMIHELFHTSSRSASVYLADFLTEIADLWKRNSLVSEVTIELDDIEKMTVSMDFAIPVGLALNELVANISEHGYPNTHHKPIRIQAGRTSDEIGLSISDDGIGFPEHVSLERPTTTGLQIIASLVQQLHGTLAVTVDNGTTFSLTLPCTGAVSSDDGCE
jgi:two-component sensor histidine kinase